MCRVANIRSIEAKLDAQANLRAEVRAADDPTVLAVECVRHLDLLRPAKPVKVRGHSHAHADHSLVNILDTKAL